MQWIHIRLPIPGLFTVGEKLGSWRTATARYEVKVKNETISTIGFLSQSTALMSDMTRIERADMKTLQRIKEDYEKLLKVLE